MGLIVEISLGLIGLKEKSRDLVWQNEKALETLVQAESSLRVEQHLDTLARLLLGVFELSEEERPLVAALDAKYDALRHVILLHTVREELGLAWTRYSVLPKKNFKVSH